MHDFATPIYALVTGHWTNFNADLYDKIDVWKPTKYMTKNTERTVGSILIEFEIMHIK